MFFLDLNYLIFMIPPFLLAIYATFITKSTFNKYSKKGVASRITGAQAARKLLDSNGLHNVGVEQVQGFLSDHYDPTKKVLRLSPGVFQSDSLAAIGVACHEAGHAIQDAKNYLPLGMRSALVPMAQIGSGLSYPILLFGALFGGLQGAPLGGLMMDVGILLLCGVVVFTIVTLPVEWDASARAKKLMVSSGIVTAQESVHAGKVLNAAFLTYVASAVSSVMTLLYWVMLRGRD